MKMNFKEILDTSQMFMNQEIFIQLKSGQFFNAKIVKITGERFIAESFDQTDSYLFNFNDTATKFYDKIK